ncbi:serine hydrolase [Flammeovirga sp. EKP202]|uniref:serine hydrolase domain-containing protein n=1 Tax=Flammeovirga sp. EKP202 TaxID=2770592 RepID=UPI00165FF336|nr:serine hydrolase domain-containing protein [Flammeovirga sp. EKP202]MBD0405444.1 beta-lactamase family protein [Flammeovirga sp. EKP202]
MKKNTMFLVLMLIAQASFSQTFNTVKKETKSVIDSIFNTKIEKKKAVGMSIAIVDNGKIVYSNGYGYSNREKEIKASDQSIYRIGSITKSFTALSLLKLQEDQKLSLEDPIQKYIPELTITSDFDSDNSIYIKDILTHSSGLPNDILNGMFSTTLPSNKWIIDALNKQKMASPRNYFNSYSNAGYSLLGELIDRESGVTYEEYIHKEIFRPLGMKNTNINTSIPVGYADDKQVQEVGVISCIGGINSSVLDMSQFIMMMIDEGKFASEKIVSESTVNTMQEERSSKMTLMDDWAGDAYGLMVQEVTIDSRDESKKEVKMYGHRGDTPIFHADYKYIPELKVGVVVLSNTDKGYVNARTLLFDYLKHEKDQKLKLSTAKRHLKQKRLATIPKEEEIIGSYGFGPYKVDVDCIEKFKLKIGKFDVVFEKRNDSLEYTMKVKAFNMITLQKTKDIYKFVKVEEEILLKKVSGYSQREFFVGKKIDYKEITNSWKKRLGKYEAINAFPCADASTFNFSSATLELKEQKGILKVKLTPLSKDGMPAHVLNIVDDYSAIETGIGRNTGTYLMVLENGNLYYNGFEFKSTKSAL